MRLQTAIEALLVDPLDRVLARSILGTDEAAQITARVEDFVRVELGREILGCPLFIQSVGAVWGLDLDDGSRVVIKAHEFGTRRLGGFATRDELDAVYAAQAELAAAGFPCAQVLRMPRPFGAGAAAVMAWLPGERAADAHAPQVRTVLANALRRTVELGRTLGVRDRLPRATLPATLFAEPHNALFDFGKPGGEWIDARARAARAVLDRDVPLVVMHGDFSCANVRVAGDQVAAVYDMDSVRWTDELRCLASAAVHFTYAGDPPWTLPSRDEARAFVADYLGPRELSADERVRLDAAAIYAMAYTARCEHGGDGGPALMCDLLAAAPDAYF